MRFIRLLPAAFAFVFLIASHGAHADPANPYASGYKSRIDAPAGKAVVSNVRVFRGADRDADTDRVLADGYDLLGVSSFKSGEVSPEMAVAQAKAIKADMVLVYSSRVGKVPDAGQQVNTDGADKDLPKMRVVNEMQYDYEYYATYWIKR